VMRETDTQVKWPSKLKIGAKSKKDPHVKVEGKRANVVEAKRKILEVLETKVNKVTLKMDVAHTEHSHVIGKGGGNIKRVMGVTSCHIHFPDSNRHSATGEKSNQVSIAGPVEGVEAARRSIRDLQPLTLTFDLPVSLVPPQQQPAPSLDAAASSPVVQQVAQALGVAVSFQTAPHAYGGGSSCSVRGLQGNAAAVQKAVCILTELLLGPEVGGQGAGPMVSSHLDVTSQQHLFMLGQNGAHFLAVMHQTQTQIILPDLSAPQSAPSLLVQGSPEGVCLARQQLMDCLPVCLMFDMREDGETDPRRLSQMMQDMEVFISIKPKVKQTSKGLERNMASLYEARRLLLGLDSGEMAKVAQTTPDTALSANELTNYWLALLLQQLRLSDRGSLPAQTPEVPAVPQCHNKPRPSLPPGLATPTEEGRSGLNWNGTDCRPLEKILENEDQSGQSGDESGGPRAMTSSEVCEASSGASGGGGGVRMLTGRRGSLQGPELLLSMEPEGGGGRRDRKSSLRREVMLVQDVLGDDESSLRDERKPVVTQVQTPTDTWSGLGFSKSMPAEAVKEFRNVSRRSYKPYLGDASASHQQLWANQAAKDRVCNGSASDNWRDRRGSASSSSGRGNEKTSDGSFQCSGGGYFEGGASGSRRASTCSQGAPPPREGRGGGSRRASTCSQRSPSPVEDDLSELLCQLGLGKYLDVLHQQEVDYQTFLTLSDQEQEEALGHVQREVRLPGGRSQRSTPAIVDVEVAGQSKHCVRRGVPHLYLYLYLYLRIN
ncbi:hypothetical protein CRUP_027340, partial [Coryphaenoides rupestris]